MGHHILYISQPHWIKNIQLSVWHLLLTIVLHGRTAKSTICDFFVFVRFAEIEAMIRSGWCITKRLCIIVTTCTTPRLVLNAYSAMHSATENSLLTFYLNMWSFLTPELHLRHAQSKVQCQYHLTVSYSICIAKNHIPSLNGSVRPVKRTMVVCYS